MPSPPEPLTPTLFDTDPETYAQVAVPVPAPGPFTYSVPDHARPLALPGSRVRIVFSGRKLTGVVVATATRAPEGVPVDRIRPIDDCLDPLPLVPPVLLALTHQVAESTLSTWGEAIRSALPTGLNRLARRRVALTDEGIAAARELGEGGPRRPEDDLLRALVAAEGRGVALGSLMRRNGTDGICARLYSLAERGLVAVEDEWSSGVGGRWRRAVRRARQVSRADALDRTARAPVQRRLVEALWDAGSPVPIERLCESAACRPEIVRALVAKGIVETIREEVGAAGETSWSAEPDGAGTFDLTPAQGEALRRIGAASSSGGFHAALLHGVTGSGKTEVYLRAARRVIEGGRTAILLVPEIGLTPLLEHRARAVLGDAVGVLHSGLSEGERLAAWWRARNGRARAIIGPRSAIFAPLDNVGFIVVDEEQDAAYKQDEAPRYHGREVALQRGRLEGAVVVLGSATPAIETFYRADSGRCELLEIPERVASRPLPEVSVVDMREEWKRSGRSLLSEQLETALGECLDRGDQAMLLLNRRGFAAALMCRVCGERIPCPHCSVSLTLHRQQRELRCHYCDYRCAVPELCPVCGANGLHEMGYGTQQLQQTLQQLFPAARTRRFDADETRRKGAHAQILSAFARGDLDMLVGTQMLAKGHDFPGVTLVGVVGADDPLGLPDFRAAERTFQLLTQMAGRAGRGEAAGEVVLQAFQPNHYAIESALRHDYGEFFARELEFRRRLGYPPFAALIACLCRGKQLAVVKEEADNLAAAIREVGAPGVQVLGPASPPLPRLRGVHRVQLMLRGTDRRELRQALTDAVASCRERRRAPRDLRIDVDPLNLM